MMLRKPRIITPEEAQVRLEELCARAEHCEWELFSKLRTWKIAPDEAERIVARLRASRFVDDARYARAFVRDKFRFMRWGRLKIQNALRVKRIHPSIIAECLAEIDPEEYEQTARELVQRKMAALPEELRGTYEGRTKVFRAVAARGFEPAIIAKTMK